MFLAISFLSSFNKMSCNIPNDVIRIANTRDTRIVDIDDEKDDEYSDGKFLDCWMEEE